MVANVSHRRRRIRRTSSSTIAAACMRSSSTVRALVHVRAGLSPQDRRAAEWVHQRQLRAVRARLAMCVCRSLPIAAAMGARRDGSPSMIPAPADVSLRRPSIVAVSGARTPCADLRRASQRRASDVDLGDDRAARTGVLEARHKQFGAPRRDCTPIRPAGRDTSRRRRGAPRDRSPALMAVTLSALLEDMPLGQPMRQSGSCARRARRRAAPAGRARARSRSRSQVAQRAA